MTKDVLSRRMALMTGLATLAAPAIARAQVLPPATSLDVPRNISTFVRRHWSDHFETLGKGALLADISSRAVHYWNPDGTYLLFPSSVPLTEELTRRGYTEVVRKRVGPTWTPTAAMRERDPSLPTFMEAGPGNPLGTHALYLGWPAYLVHGTHDTRKIGRMSSSGCIGLYNEHIAQLFEKAVVGTQVRLF